MLSQSKIRSLILFLGDAAVLYFSLFLTLILRYGWFRLGEQWAGHWRPFSIIFGLWIIIFYINGLYDPKKLKIGSGFGGFYSAGLITGTSLAALFFYLIPYFGITPKTNLFILIFIFGLLDYWARKFLNKLFISKGFQTKLLFTGSDTTTAELIGILAKNPQLGYQTKLWLKTGLKNKNVDEVKKIIKDEEIDSIILSPEIQNNPENAKLIYRLISSGTSVTGLNALYESALQKIPLAIMEENWLMETAAGKQKFIDIIKRMEDLTIAAIALAVALPVSIFLLPVIALISGFPIFYKQKRMGKNEKEFWIYKLRTMRLNAEAEGPQWSSGKNDERIAPLGGFLRKTHIDEIPQLYNILKGELSFVGPRPERPEFVKPLKEQVPFYEMRHLIKPGITGWAQINYRYGSSIEDAYQKLQYDLYYLKNRSFFLDISIILKTIKMIFISHG
ncbi:MAG: exopolysaccharide biosynthesis polyprenyl glycosylphosphotransferase [Candidatus Brennerbacteria bacterium]|nr:exopolysaccharide biosynthesis polyprenyl glycosylphosphotransferase [Candidatus Brennerbacteria bacterium]